MLALAGVAFGDPAHWIAWTVVFPLVLGFAGATQDVTIDGWRIRTSSRMDSAVMDCSRSSGHKGPEVAAAFTLVGNGDALHTATVECPLMRRQERR